MVSFETNFELQMIILTLHETEAGVGAVFLNVLNAELIPKPGLWAKSGCHVLKLDVLKWGGWGL